MSMQAETQVNICPDCGLIGYSYGYSDERREWDMDRHRQTTSHLFGALRLQVSRLETRVAELEHARAVVRRVDGL